ncbi:MAG: signal recognition particle-docking protein FtsY [Candidatus Woesearchaeota archaeon]
MFKFLKEKLKKAISSIGKKAEKEAPEEETPIEEVKEIPKKEVKVEEKPKEEKKGFFAKLRKKEPKKETPPEKPKTEPEITPEPPKIKPKEPEIEKPKELPKEEPKEDIKEKPPEKEEVKEIIKEEVKEKPKEEKKGFFAKFKEKIVTKKISEETFKDLFYELEIALLENNVAVEVIEKIKEDLKKELVNQPIPRGRIENTVKYSLKNSITSLFELESFNLIKEIKKSEKPYIILFLGVNGSGKTTTIAKIANLLQKNKLSVVLGAGDSFRKAAIEQLEEWGKRLKVKVIKHDYGSDPAAICFDTIKFAQAHNLDVVLLDTAGRQHSNKNLIEELKKINRVSKPNLKIFIGESIVGNDAVNQSKDFNEAVGIDAIILTKSDVDEKGGAIVSISHVTKKPIIYLGHGQNPSDLEEFNKEKILKNLGF